FSSGIALLHTNTPELPPGSRCIHSICRIKFSYCFSLRITPMGSPVLTSSSSLTDQVSSAVLTLTHRMGTDCSSETDIADPNGISLPISSVLSCVSPTAEKTNKNTIPPARDLHELMIIILTNYLTWPSESCECESE